MSDDFKEQSKALQRLGKKLEGIPGHNRPWKHKKFVEYNFFGNYPLEAMCCLPCSHYIVSVSVPNIPQRSSYKPRLRRTSARTLAS